jgi:exoribonuclease II
MPNISRKRQQTLCLIKQLTNSILAKLYIVSVFYISNVTLLLDNLGVWKSFSDRVSTIYLPDRKRPMLPTILSDGLCSLVQEKTRLALVMDIFIVEGFVLDIQYKNAKIRVAHNYRYED